MKRTGEPVEIIRSAKMAKSKKNVINPEDLIAQYGADTARWYIISDSPPDRDIEWTTTGVEAANKHLQRVLRLASEAAASGDCGDADEDEKLARAVHRTIDRVTRGIEGFAFNKSVASLYEFTNAIARSSAGAGPKAEALGMLARLMSPMTPHLAEEVWTRLGNNGLVAAMDWPVADPVKLFEDSVVMPIQVNGKRRSELVVARGTERGEIERRVLDDAAVRRTLAGATARKIVVVPDRIVNVVT